MKKYLLIILVITIYYSCDKDKPDPPEEKYCLHPFFDAKIKRLERKAPNDTNYYIKGFFNGVPRITNYYCLEYYSLVENGVKYDKFLSHFVVHVCDSFYMGFSFLRPSYPYQLIEDKIKYHYNGNHGVTLFFIDNFKNYEDPNNNFYKETYFPYFAPGELTSIHNFVTVEKISKDSIIEGSFEMDLVNAEKSRMIVKDGKFRIKAKPNSCSD